MESRSLEEVRRKPGGYSFKTECNRCRDTHRWQKHMFRVAFISCLRKRAPTTLSIHRFAVARQISPLIVFRP